MGEVYVVNKATGALEAVPEEDLPLLGNNYRRPDEAEVRGLELKAVAEANPAAAAAHSFLDAATLGAKSYMDRNVFGLSEDELAYEQAKKNTTAGTIGTVSGYVAPALAGAGVFRGAASGLNALKYTPAGMAARGAQAAGNATTNALRARGVGEGLARAGGLAVEGGVEGTIIGAGEYVSDTSQADQDLSSEKLLAAAANESLWGIGIGGGIGLGLGAASRALRRPASGADDALPPPRLDEPAALPPGELPPALPAAADDVADGVLPPSEPSGLIDSIAHSNIARRYYDSASISTGIDAADIERAVTSPEARRNWVRRGELSDEYTQRLRQHVDEMAESEQVVRRVFAGDLKADKVAATINRGAEVRARGLAFAEDLKAQTDGLLSDANIERFGRANASKLKKLVDQTHDNIAALAAREGTEDQIFLAHENLKRGFQKLTKKAGRSTASDPFTAARNREVNAFADSMQQRLIRHTTDADTYGQVAAEQAARNAAGAEYFGWADKYARKFLAETGEKLDDEWWRNRRVANPEALGSYVDGLLNPRKDLVHQLSTQANQGRRRLLDTLIEQGDATGADLEALQRARDATVRYEQTLSEASRSMADANLVQQVVQASADEASVQGLAASAMSGAAFGGMTGALASVARNAVPTPGTLVKRMATLESMAERSRKVDSRITRSLGGFIKTAGNKIPKSLGGASKYGKAARTAAYSAATKAFGKTPDERRDKFNKFAGQVQEFKANPAAASDHVSQRVVGSIAGPTPAIAAAVAQKHAVGMSFLASKLPEMGGFAASLQPHLAKPNISDAEIARFARYATAISDPLSVIDDAKNGQLTTEAVDALKAVYPRLFAQMQAVAMEALAKTTVALPYNDVVQLSLLLDIPGHPTLEPSFISRHQQIMAQHEAPGPSAEPSQSAPGQPRPGLPKTSQLAKSPADKVAELL